MKDYFYKTKIDKRLKILELLFLLLSMTMFSIVLFDSFFNHLPFHYVLFFIVGLILSRLFKLTYKIEWHEQRKKIIRTMSIQGLILLITLIAARYLLIPKFIGTLSIDFISDAILLVAMGIFLGRIFHFKRTTDNYMYEYFMKNNK